jgi:hypothetical protein
MHLNVFAHQTWQLLLATCTPPPNTHPPTCEALQQRAVLHHLGGQCIQPPLSWVCCLVNVGLNSSSSRVSYFWSAAHTVCELAMLSICNYINTSWQLLSYLYSSIEQGTRCYAASVSA